MASSFTVKVLSDITGLTDGLNAANRRLTKFQKRIIAGAGAAGTTIAGALVANLAKGLKGLSEQEDANAKFADALSRSTSQLQGSSDALKAQADQIQLKTKFTYEDALAVDTLIASQQSLSGVVSKGLIPVQDLTKLSLDLATVLGTTGPAAAAMLGKALAKPEAASRLLVKAGVDLTTSQDAGLKAMVKAGDTAGAQAIILAALEARTRGAAEAAGTTLSGQMTRLKNSFGEVQENLASGLLPTIQKLTEKALAFSEWAQKNPEIIRGVAIAAGVLAAAFGVLAVAQLAVMVTNPFTLTILGAAAAIAAIGFLWLKFKGFREFLGGFYKLMINGYRLAANASIAWALAGLKAIQGVTEAAGRLPKWLGGGIADNAASAIGAIIGGVESLRDTINSTADAAIGLIDRLQNVSFDSFKGAGSDPGGIVAAWKNAEQKIADSQMKLDTSNLLKDLGKGLGGAAEEIDKGASKLEDAIRKRVQAARDKVKQAKDLAKSIREAFSFQLNAMTFDETSRSATLQYDLDQQLKKIKAFRVAIEQLKAKGLRGSALTKLVEGGPGNLAAAQEILNTNGVAGVNKTSAAIDAESKRLALGEVMRRTGIDLNKDKPVRVVFDVTGAGDEMKALIRKIVRTDGGGDVAVAFGRK